MAWDTCFVCSAAVKSKCAISREQGQLPWWVPDMWQSGWQSGMSLELIVKTMRTFEVRHVAGGHAGAVVLAAGEEGVEQVRDIRHRPPLLCRPQQRVIPAECNAGL